MKEKEMELSIGELRAIIRQVIEEDMKNVGGEAGAITAALFLDEFVGETTWAHIDIAGPMWTDADNGWLQKGMTGYGTRLLIDAALNFRKPGRA